MHVNCFLLSKDIKIFYFPVWDSAVRYSVVWCGAVRGGLSVTKRSHKLIWGMRDECASATFGYLRRNPTRLFKSSGEGKYTNNESEKIGNILSTAVKYMRNSL